MVFGNGISFAGLGSGIDSTALIERLVALEGIRKGQMAAQRDEYKETKSAFGKLESLVQTLRSRAEELSKSGKFLQLKATSSVEGALSFDVSSTASTGSHSIEVQQLASNDRWAFDGVADHTTDLGAGNVSFSVGATNYNVAVGATDSSLDEIAAAINNAAGDDVTASVVNTGSSTTPSWKLVLAADDSGDAGKIHAITSTSAGLTIDNTEPAPGSSTPVSANHLVVGSNAKALIDGLLVERDTNEFDDVIAGVSFTALTADPGTTIDLTIEPDSEGIVEAIDDFVSAYNAVVEFTNKQSSYDEEKGAGGPLFGDSSMGVIRSKLRSSLFNVDLAAVQADTQGFSTLNLVGLEVQNDGTIELDKTKLEEKIVDDVDALADLFADDDGFDDGALVPGDPGYGVDQTDDSGVAATLLRTIDSMLKTVEGVGGVSVKGLFGTKQDSLQKMIADFDKRIDMEDVRLDKYEETLRMRFANLEALMGGLNTQSAALQAF